jgi:hypothetical protein
MFSLHGSNCIVVCLSLFLVVLVGTSCASGTPISAPLPMTTPTTAPLSTPTQGAQDPTPAVSPMPFAVPKELPSKGSPDAKVTLVVFCDFI